MSAARVGSPFADREEQEETMLLLVEAGLLAAAPADREVVLAEMGTAVVAEGEIRRDLEEPDLLARAGEGGGGYSSQWRQRWWNYLYLSQFRNCFGKPKCQRRRRGIWGWDSRWGGRGGGGLHLFDRRHDQYTGVAYRDRGTGRVRVQTL